MEVSITFIGDDTKRLDLAFPNNEITMPLQGDTLVLCMDGYRDFYTIVERQFEVNVGKGVGGIQCVESVEWCFTVKK